MLPTAVRPLADEATGADTSRDKGDASGIPLPLANSTCRHNRHKPYGPTRFSAWREHPKGSDMRASATRPRRTGRRSAHRRLAVHAARLPASRSLKRRWLGASRRLASPTCRIVGLFAILGLVFTAFILHQRMPPPPQAQLSP